MAKTPIMRPVGVHHRFHKNRKEWAKMPILFRLLLLAPEKAFQDALTHKKTDAIHGSPPMN
ncbi:hypothetical protein DI43_11725 [Geobacillus sp. CAMR12739]|nr:hypothetical protein DI43_11725 [Geobacillus sp. CAMR12739]